jgi:hypothetical protein
MTDDEQLAHLRKYPNWPRELDLLAKEGAESGQLIEAVHMANARLGSDLVSSSVSSVTVAPVRVPDSEYTHLPNVLGTFYAYLEDELLTVLGRPVKFN